MHRTGWSHPRIKFDLPERLLVARDVLLQKSQKRFRLLRAQVNSLKVTDFHVRLTLLLQGTEDQKKVPDIDAHLHTVGITLAIVRVVDQLHVRLYRIIHGWKCKRVSPTNGGKKAHSGNK